MKQRAFREALRIHTKLKRLPYYTQAYTRTKTLLLRISTEDWEADDGQGFSADRQAQNFCTHYEDSPLKPSVIVYEAFHGSSVACSPAAIYEAACADPRFSGCQHIWVIDDPAAVPAALAERPNTSVINRDSFEYSEILATAKYLVNNSTFPSWYTRREGQVYINTWHGTPLKTMFRDEKGRPAGFANSQRNFLQASHIIMPSDFATRNLLGAAGIAPLCTTKTWQIGTPRLDRTLAARKNWIPTKGRREILFAPTWRGTFGSTVSQVNEIENLIRILCNAGGDSIRLHIKAHNFNFDDLSDITRLETGTLTIHTVDPRSDINDVMAQMDVVISDYSSLMFDALAADIPVLLFVPDLIDYSAARGIYFDPETLPLTVCHHETDLLTALAAPRPASAFDQADAARNTYYPDEDGQAAARALNVMLGAETAPDPLARAAKPIITMMAGGWKRNGITSSALNLLSNINPETYNVVVLTDGQSLSDEAWSQIDKAPPGVMFVHRVGKEGFTPAEERAKTVFYRTNALTSPTDGTLMQQAMRREARRVIGGLRSQAVIEFSGYRRLWVWIMAMMNADQKIIYQHNDMKSERDSRFADLEGVFHVYQHYDQIVAVSEETRALNFSNLNSYYNEEKSLALRNTLNTHAIKRAASGKSLTVQIKKGSYTVLDLITAESGDVLHLKAIPTIDPSKTNFITMGRASHEKNHAMLLQAFKQLLETQPQSHLYILGEGPLLEETLALRDKLGLRGYVTLPGFSDSALHLLDQCDCFVLPSLYEGQPMVVLEALTLGKPVIVTDIAGSRSALQGGYGHIVEGPASAKSFAAAMEAFCQDRLTFKTFDADLYNAQAVADFYTVLSPQKAE